MKKIMTATALVLLMLGLASCASETLEQRIENRDRCEDAGGIYEETISGWTYEYSGWNCDLSTEED